MRDLLRSLWDEPRPAQPRVPLWRDLALICACALVAVGEVLARPELPNRWLALAVFLITLPPLLLLRRSRPLLAVVLSFTISSLPGLFTTMPELYVSGFYLLLPYSLFRWGSGREIVLGFTLMLIGLLTTRPANISEAVGGATVLVAMVSLGATVRYRSTVRMRELERVKILEREHLARDLHDTVAHHFSAIAIRAQAGLAVPDASQEQLRLIEAEASRALAEMRTMVRILRRNDPAELTPAPGVADLAEMTGVHVRLDGDLDNLPPALGTAIYRIAQESVTNARRHARHATRVDVHVSADTNSIHLTVTDDGDPAHAATPGFGLTGMIERAELLGGTCQAGPAADGRGWTVNATIPRPA